MRDKIRPCVKAALLAGFFIALSRPLALQAQTDLLAVADPSAMLDPDMAALRRSVETIFNDSGVWAYKFLWVKPSGEKVVLSEFDSSRPMVPASTQKLFVGYFAFENNPELEAKFPKMLQRSDNDIAKEVLRRSGGISALIEFFESRGISVSEDMTMFDGSGLSYENRSTADLQVTLLAHILGTGRYADFKQLLAQPGQTGTLKYRLPQLKGSVFAKTGTLGDGGDVALSGYVETTNGTIVFSVLGNSIMCNSVAWARRMIDKVVQLHRIYVAGPLPALVAVPKKRSAPSLARNRAFLELQRANVFAQQK